MTLPRTNQKIAQKDKRQILTRWAAKRPAVTLKELQEYLTSTDYSLHVTTSFHILHMCGLGRSPLSKRKEKKQPNPTKIFQTMWQNVLWSDETNSRIANQHRSSITTLKHSGGSIMRYGYISSARTAVFIKVKNECISTNTNQF